MFKTYEKIDDHLKKKLEKNWYNSGFKEEDWNVKIPDCFGSKYNYLSKMKSWSNKEFLINVAYRQEQILGYGFTQVLMWLKIICIILVCILAVNIWAINMWNG